MLAALENDEIQNKPSILYLDTVVTLVNNWN